jgi:hypothetical protein
VCIAVSRHLTLLHCISIFLAHGSLHNCIAVAYLSDTALYKTALPLRISCSCMFLALFLLRTCSAATYLSRWIRYIPSVQSHIYRTGVLTELKCSCLKCPPLGSNCITVSYPSHWAPYITVLQLHISPKMEWRKVKPTVL